MNQDDTIIFLEGVLNSIKVRGLRKTMQLLKVESDDDIQLTDPKAIETLQVISEQFNVLVDDMVQNRYIRGDYKYAIGFAVYYLYDVMSLGDIKKKIFRNKTKTLLSRYRQIILDLDKNEKMNKKYIEIKKVLDAKLNP